jgi:hypothetical protein
MASLLTEWAMWSKWLNVNRGHQPHIELSTAASHARWIIAAGLSQF